MSGGDPQRGGEGEPIGGPDESLSEQERRLKEIDIPSSPTLPPPPDIQFQRPVLGASASRTDSPSGHTTTVKIGADRPTGSPPARSTVDNATRLGSGLGAGITFAASIVVGFLIGQWVDHRFGFVQGGIPWGTIVFVLAGLAAGFVNLFRLLSISDRASQSKR